MKKLRDEIDFYPLFLLVLGIILFSVGGSAGAQTNWNKQAIKPALSSGSGTYHKIVTGNFFADQFQVPAVLDGDKVWIMAAPMLYDPPIYCVVPVTGIKDIAAVPGGGYNGENDALAVASTSGLHVAYWKSGSGSFDCTTKISASSGITHVVADIIDEDGTQVLVYVVQDATTSTIKIAKMVAPQNWIPYDQFTINGKVQDLVPLFWEAGTTRQIAVVREVEGLDVFTTDGTSLFHEWHWGLPVHPDRLARLDHAERSTDTLLWITSISLYPEFNEQVLYEAELGQTFRMLPLGYIDVLDADTADIDLDGDAELILRNRGMGTLILDNNKETNPQGPYYGIGSQDMTVLTYDTPGPYLTNTPCAAAMDADNDGDMDLYGVFNDSGLKSLYFFSTGAGLDYDQIPELDRTTPNLMNWDLQPRLGDPPSPGVPNECFEYLTINIDPATSCPSWATDLEIIAFYKDNQLTELNRTAIKRIIYPLTGQAPLAPTQFVFVLELQGTTPYDTIYHLWLRFIRRESGRITRTGPLNLQWFCPDYDILFAMGSSLPVLLTNLLEVFVDYNDWTPSPHPYSGEDPDPAAGTTTGPSTGQSQIPVDLGTPVEPPPDPS